MAYAVIQTGGKQYRVESGNEIDVEKLDVEVGTDIDFSEVLLVSDGADLQVGEPFVSGAKVSAEVVDLRTLRPIDYDTVLASVMKTNRCVTVEEGFPVGSIGDHLASTIMQRAFDYLDAPVVTCTGKDVPMPYAANLEKLALVTTAEVVAAVKSVCYR